MKNNDKFKFEFKFESRVFLCEKETLVSDGSRFYELFRKSLPNHFLVLLQSLSLSLIY